MNKIRRLSLTLKYVFYALMIVYPIFVVMYWIWPQNALQLGVICIPASTQILHVMSATEKLLGFAVQFIPNLMVMGIIYYLAKLFSYYEKGLIFMTTSTECLKKIGYLLLSQELLTTFIANPLIQFVITIHNPPHHRYANIDFGNYDLYAIFVALMFLLIAWIMAEACQLQSEQSLTI